MQVPRWAVWTGAGLVVLLAAVAVAILAVERYLSTVLRERAIATLERRLDGRVELAELDVFVRHKIQVRGSRFVLRHEGRRDVPPLVSIGSFRADVSWAGLLSAPRRVSNVDVVGLRITIPPGPPDDVRGDESGGCRSGETTPAPSGRPEASPFVVETLVSSGAELVILPSKEGKRPRVFAIERVQLSQLALDRPADFQASLTNPVPRGRIATTGRFGPWQARRPGAAPVSGDYRFSDADLGTINGIAGTLESTGRYDGILQEILVSGETRVPDFGLDTSRNRLPLEVRFDACVDGTDGDTYLRHVDARLQDTPIVASGKVEGHVGVDGRTVALDVDIEEGRLEDLLRLAVDEENPVMTGGIDVTTRFVLPPGDGDVVGRLDLDGRFALRDTTFTSQKIQGKVNELSRRGRGDMDQKRARPVRSALGGRFILENANLRLSTFRFAVPGAEVQLQGRYGLRSEAIDFRGRVKLNARVSEMTTGFKSILLKAVDPLFARDGAGAVFPITVTGTRAEPSVDVDVKRALLRKD